MLAFKLRQRAAQSLIFDEQLLECNLADCEPPEMRDAALKMLEALEWNGIAMVEFRRHRDTGEFYFIEINPRFVGSLELAVAAGVDLPWLLAQQAAKQPVLGPTRYRVGLKYRWLISKNLANAFENPLGYWRGALASLLPGSAGRSGRSSGRPNGDRKRWWVFRNSPIRIGMAALVVLVLTAGVKLLYVHLSMPRDGDVNIFKVVWK